MSNNDKGQVPQQKSANATLDKKPSYLLELEAKWVRWTGIKDPEAAESLKDLSGDLWGELRKLEAQLCKEIENRELPEDFKEFVKARIRDSWRDIIGHQKIGMDKLGIVVRTHLEDAKNKEK
jgi:hypothetical protein